MQKTVTVELIHLVQYTEETSHKSDIVLCFINACWGLVIVTRTILKESSTSVPTLSHVWCLFFKYSGLEKTF